MEMITLMDSQKVKSGDYPEYSCPEKKTEKTRNNEAFEETDWFITMIYVPFHCFCLGH